MVLSKAKTSRVIATKGQRSIYMDLVANCVKLPASGLGGDLSAIWALPRPGKMRIIGTYARVPNHSCASPTQPRGDSGADFYYRKVDGVWTQVFGTQNGVPCAKVDGQGWPRKLIPRCWEPDGKLRRPT